MSKNADSVRIRNVSEQDGGTDVTKKEVYNMNGIRLFLSLNNAVKPFLSIPMGPNSEGVTEQPDDYSGRPV
jgi:hypothetical protein